MVGILSDVVQEPPGPSYRISRPISLRIAFAASRLGWAAANKSVYCRAACADDDTEVGKITSAKMTITIVSRTTSVPNMMARSFVKIDGCHRGLQRCLVIAASNEEVAGA